MKKFLATIITTSIMLSFAVISVHASGFSGANILGGAQVRGEFTASHGGSSDEYYTRSHSGSGANRVICDTMKKSWKKQYALMESGIADPLDGTDYDKVHFAHARIKIAVKKVNNEYVVLRLFPVQSDWTKEGDASRGKSIFNLVYSNEYSTYGWMSVYGTIPSGSSKIPAGVTEYDRCHIYTSTDPSSTATKSYEGRNFLRFGTTDTPDYQTFDFIFDCYKGYVYGYVDGRLIATKVTGTHFDNFYGYTICGTGDETSFAEGTKIWFKYDTERPGETLYVDTDDYTVRLEDVLVDAGLASKNSDPHNIMESDHVADYVFAGDTDYNYYDTYERRDGSGNPVSITAEKLKTGAGNVAQLYGGCYYKGYDWPGYANGKGVIHVSFDQKINTKLNSGSNVASSSYSCKVTAQGSKSYDLFYLEPDGSNKMKITLEKQQGSGNPQITLDKDFNDTIHYDIVLYGKHYNTEPVTSAAEAVGYYFADGQYIGTYTINRGADAATAGTDEWWTPTQLLLYSNNTANVTYSNYKIALYDENKRATDLVNEIDSSRLSWADICLNADGNGFTVSGRVVEGSGSVPAGAKAYIGIYDEDGKLLDCDSTAYASASGITSKRFSKTPNPAYAKLFLWDGVEPVTSEQKILFRNDPLTYYVEASYDNGMSWNKTNYRADYSNAADYSYPVENREILQGTIRDRDNIFIKIANGSYQGSVINIEDTVFDTVTLTKGVDYMGYAFLAEKPEVYTHSPKFPSGFTPTYAAGYTRVRYTEDPQITLSIPDNAKYIYLYNNGISDETHEYEDCFPSAITFSRSGNSTQNDNSVRLATWNIGHFSLGENKNSSIDSLGFTAADYQNYINAINADVIGLNEYSEMFDSTQYARNAVFGNYTKRYEGVQRQYSCNAIYAKNDVNITNMQLQEFNCYSSATGSGIKPANYYYITSDLNINGQTVKLVSVHLYYEDEPQEYAKKAINELISVFAGYDKVILMGDWNSTYNKFQIFQNAGYSVAQTDSRLATYSECQGSKYNTDIVDGYGSYDNIIYKGVTVSNFGLAGTKLSDHYAIYCDVMVE